MSLLVLSISSRFIALSTSPGELCSIIGSVEGCADAKVYSAGVAERGGEVLAYSVELLLAVTRGSGAVFIYAEPLVDETFILSSRVAAVVASTYAGRNFSSYNYYILVKSPSARVQGPSLSAAIGVGFVLAILGTDVGKPIAVTGVLMPDGSIGPVGYPVEKVVAVSAVARKIFVPAVARGSALANETLADLAELGRSLGAEVVEVSSIGEVLRLLGIYTPSTGRSVGESQVASRVAAGLVDHLGKALENALGRVAAACGEEAADKFVRKLDLSATHGLGGGSLATLGRLISSVVEAESTAWLCDIGREIADLDVLVYRVFERLKTAESACHFYSKTVSTSLSSVVAFSTVCWFLINAWEEFNRSLEEARLERQVHGLVESMHVADCVFLALDLLGGIYTQGAEHTIDLRRVQGLWYYTSALLDSLSRGYTAASLSAQSLSRLRHHLQVGANWSTYDLAVSLAHTLKVLSELVLFTYLSQYGGTAQAVQASRSGATAYAASTGEPTVSMLVELGDYCVQYEEVIEKCLYFYVMASTVGFALSYISTEAAASFWGWGWHWLLLAVATGAVFVVTALLLRRGRLFSSRTLRYLYLLQLVPHRSPVVRR